MSHDPALDDLDAIRASVAALGSGPTQLGKAEDAPAVSGDVGVPALGVRSDTPASTAGTTGDYANQIQDASGGTWVALESAGAPVSFAGITGIYRLLSALGTTQDATSIKATPGFVFHIIGRNSTTSIRYLKLYNKASTPTVGTDPPVATIELPPNTVNGGYFDFQFEQGIYFSLGIGFGLVTASADNSTASVTAGDITSLNIFYQ